MKLQQLAVFGLLSLLLSACGGGGGSSNDNNAEVVSVNAGANQTVNEGNSFTLTAVADPTGGAFGWRQLTGTTLTGMPATTASVTLTAPKTKTEQLLAFQVTYTTASGQIRTDEVQVTVQPLNTAPVAVASVTKPAIVPVVGGQTVELSATSSYDPDADGQISSYLWQQLSGPAVTLSGASSGTLTFTAPLLASASNLAFRLTVTDDENASHSTELTVPVRASTNAVYANAGVDQQSREFAVVRLDGSGSQSVNGAVSCAWSQLRGQSVILQNANQCQANFVAPDISGTSEIELKLQVTDPTGKQASDTVVVTIVNAVLGDLADTGVDQCFDNSGVIPCGDAAYPRQDAEHGRDSVQPYLRKVGIGNNAFDFTKLDRNGDELADDATDFACLRDNVTGLIWELKQPGYTAPPNSELRAANNRYSFVSKNAGNGSIPGEAADPNTSCPSDKDCSTETYIAEVNATVYCGGANWRLPTLVELMSLADFSLRGEANLLDENLFLFEPSVYAQGNMYYWTSETSSEGGGGYSAWVFDLANGNDNTLPKQASELAYVRLVRNP